ncbi:MAG TPA: LysE family transporter [Candidatus Bathyarchaeia archaeon]|nr:LysE family transporter [Candidatus Bathyarchaeia archaeon]
MITLEFLATVIFLSASGVLGPGPLFVSSTTRATKLGWGAGMQSAVGHTVFEAPLVLGLAIGLSTFLNPSTAKLIGIPGGIVLLGFAILQIQQAIAKEGVGPTSDIAGRLGAGSGVLLGILFTGANPFFLIWWLTIGSVLIVQAISLGALTGVVIMYGAHIWMDYAWLGGTAFLAFRGRLFLGKWYRAMMIVFGTVMAYFGVVFILSAVF